MSRTSEADLLFKERENTTRAYLTPNQYAIIRLDGRAFHSYCAGLAKPNDDQFIDDMNKVAVELSKQIDGVRLSYVQSDEISLLLTDWTSRTATEDSRTEFMFGGNIQKLISISAAIASTTMNHLRYGIRTDKIAVFDARAFSLNSRQETVDYFAWRQRDAGVNSLTMHANTHFSHRELDGLSSAARRDKLIDAGIDPKSTPEGFRLGRVVRYLDQPGNATYTDKFGVIHRTEFTRRVPVAVTAPRFASDDSLVPAAPYGKAS